MTRDGYSSPLPQYPTDHVGPDPFRCLFYGVQATGNGHIYRYRGISRELIKRQFLVRSVAIGQELFAKNAPTDSWMKGLSFDVDEKGIHFLQTLAHGLEEMPKYLRAVDRVAELIEQSQCPTVLSDFEPLTSRAAMELSLPLFLLDNQTSVFCPARRGKRHRALIHLARWFTKFWYGIKSLQHASRIFTVSLSPEQPGLPNQVVVPAPVRQEILDLHPVRGQHAVIYASFGSIPPELFHAAATTHRNLEIRVHVPDPPNQVQAPSPNLIIRKAPSSEFLNDLRTCGAVIAQAGFMTSAEAALLGKPVAMVPLQGQFEQILNGMEFERLGVGRVFQNYGTSLLDWVVAHRNQSQVSKEVVNWLGAGIAAVANTLEQSVLDVGTRRVANRTMGN
jgi:uncharacterized protein (TIGR00661 family)